MSAPKVTDESLALTAAHRKVDAAEQSKDAELLKMARAELEQAEEAFRQAVLLHIPVPEPSVCQSVRANPKDLLRQAYADVKKLREQNKQLHAALQQNVVVKRLYNKTVIPQLREEKRLANQTKTL